MPRPALLAVSHGTSDAAGAAAIALLVRRVAERLPDVAVHSGFVDVQQPDAPTALAAVEGPVVVVPLLLSQGFHVRVDLGRAVSERSDAVVTDPLGPDPRLAKVLALRLADADAAAHPGGGTDRPVVLAVAGSRDPRSLPDAEAMAALLSEDLGRAVVPAYLAAREPSLTAARELHPDAAVATYLLAHGYFFDVAERVAGSALLTEPLLDDGEPPAPLVDLVVDRYLAGEAELRQLRGH
ncbi:cobalamin biosynthesis protein CbiX [Microbacterium sp. Au-Mic1]|uniref:sirohydrochlorin chelatase n=1 Tax=Microbacterium sp. Au-Mic1 TaxID=2906457 RepID=UPI001E322C94|nr:CbiX/SirB N-terminal domain-containing protein [Microbacterium sp. Au-Mic1]MCE4027002.1 cobalamin biosynthesis protein CbiX [Microbacterium sp. Au-Mic1]